MLIDIGSYRYLTLNRVCVCALRTQPAEGKDGNVHTKGVSGAGGCRIVEQLDSWILENLNSTFKFDTTRMRQCVRPFTR